MDIPGVPSDIRRRAWKEVARDSSVFVVSTVIALLLVAVNSGAAPLIGGLAALVALLFVQRLSVSVLALTAVQRPQWERVEVYVFNDRWDFFSPWTQTLFPARSSSVITYCTFVHVVDVQEQGQIAAIWLTVSGKRFGATYVPGLRAPRLVRLVSGRKYRRKSRAFIGA